MSVTIGKYSFEGPYKNTGALKSSSGIYAILCRQHSGLNVVDIGESSEVKNRVENHDRTSCWNGKCPSRTLEVAVLYTPNLSAEARINLEQELRDKFNNLCGDR